MADAVTVTGTVVDACGDQVTDVVRAFVTTPQRVVNGSIVAPRLVDLPLSGSVSVRLLPGPATLAVRGKGWSMAIPLMVSAETDTLATAAQAARS